MISALLFCHYFLFLFIGHKKDQRTRGKCWTIKLNNETKLKAKEEKYQNINFCFVCFWLVPKWINCQKSYEMRDNFCVCLGLKIMSFSCSHRLILCVMWFWSDTSAVWIRKHININYMQRANAIILFCSVSFSLSIMHALVISFEI